MSRFYHQALKELDFLPRNKWLRSVLFVYVGIAMFAPLLAGREPLAMQYKGEICFPGFNPDPYFNIRYDEDSSSKTLKKQIDWRLFDADWKIMPLACYAPEDIDLKNANCVSPFDHQYYQTTTGIDAPLPFRYRHWLGTTNTGGDVLSILVYGSATSLVIGLLSMLVAALIGVTLGSLSGFYANDRMRAPLAVFFSSALAVPFGIFYGIRLAEALSIQGSSGRFLSVLITIPAIFYPVSRLLFRIGFFKRQIRLPIDRFHTVLSSGFIAVPRLMIVLMLAVLFPPSIWSVILIIGLISWTEIARMIRTELFRLRTSGFMEHARATGMSDLRILMKHGLPNISSITVNVLIAGVASAILMESALSFLGVGMPPRTASWGYLLSEARNDFRSWWLLVFPGVSLFLVTFSLYRSTDRNQSRN